jgi:hypothetical protein
LLVPSGPPALEELVERTSHGLALERLPAAPEVVKTVLHADADGRPRVLFVINPSSESIATTAAVPGARAARDALTDEHVSIVNERVTLAVAARTVTVLELD